MRSSPQVIGAAHDAVAFARRQVETELNGVADNPIFLPDAKLTLTGANFQGSPVSLPMDMVGAAVTMVCVLSERRLNRLTNPALSVGLPAFLTKGAGMFSGMMLQPVHGRHADRRTTDPFRTGFRRLHPGRRRPGGLCLDGDEHGD
ncbi:MAG: hutH, partial [Acidobacteria bacterium]|nr:hutH [Acidobacteriota bacterium]